MGIRKIGGDLPLDKKIPEMGIGAAGLAAGRPGPFGFPLGFARGFGKTGQADEAAVPT